MYDRQPHYPDSLTLTAINALIWSVAQEIADEAKDANAPMPTSRLMASTAASRREDYRNDRRAVRADISAVVRHLPMKTTPHDPALYVAEAA